VAHSDHKQRHGERVHLLHPAPFLQPGRQSTKQQVCRKNSEEGQIVQSSHQQRRLDSAQHNATYTI
jgi:hypothetical protein